MIASADYAALSDFPISKTAALAEFVIDSGGARELHWVSLYYPYCREMVIANGQPIQHPNSDEWDYFIS